VIDTDFYLVIYDICNDRRLQKVAKKIGEVNSMRIQKSVYEVQGDKNEIYSLIHEIERIIDVSVDKVAFIPLCQNDYDKEEFFGVMPKRANKYPAFFIL